MATLSSYFISTQRLLQEFVWNAITHPSTEKIYLGGINSTDPERKNLIVCDLPRYPDYDSFQHGYPDNSIPLQVGRRSCVSSLALSVLFQKIYLLVYEEGSHSGRATASSYLSIYNLDVNGNVAGNVISYKLNKPNVINADTLVLHPTLPLLYISEVSGIQVYNLDPQTGLPGDLIAGNPLPVADYDHKNSFAIPLPPAGNFLNTLAIHDNGKRLYAGTAGNLFIVATLDLNGLLQGVPAVFNDNPIAGNFTWGGDGLDAQIKDPFYFHFTPKAIYRSVRPAAPQYFARHGNFPLRVWQLDVNGDILNPVLNPTPAEFKNVLWDTESFIPTTTAVYCTQPVFFNDALNAAQKRIGGFALNKYPLDANGLPLLDAQGNPTGAVLIANYDVEEPFLMRLTSSNTPAVLSRAFPIALADSVANGEVPQIPGSVQVLNQFLKCTIISSSPKVDNTWSLQAVCDSQPLTITVPINANVAILPLDKLFLQFQSQGGFAKQQVMLTITLFKGGTAVSNASWKLEYFDGDPAAGGISKKTLTDSAYGKYINCLIDSYAYQNNSPQGRYDRFNLLSSQWQSWAAQAASVAMPVRDHLQKFIFSCYAFEPSQAHQKQVESMIQLVQSLGFNTVISEDNYVFSVLPQGADTIKKSGINDFMGAVYNILENPPAILNLPANSGNLYELDFFLESVDINYWANEQVSNNKYQLFGGRQMINFGMHDEFAFTYLSVINDLNANLLYDDIFHDRWHAFLESEGLKPADFGQPNWDTVKALNLVPDPTLGNINDKKIYYWAIRFLQISFIRGFNIGSLALKKVFPNLKYAYVNLNTLFGWRSNANLLNLDWFEIGRSGNQILWSESWIADNEAWEWSFANDFLGSAANSSHANASKYLPIGSYIVGDAMGSHPAGALYKVFTSISRNAKVLDLYSLGTYQGVNPWVMFPEIYKPISDALKLLGKTESFLYDASPMRSRVALFSTGASMIWDNIDVTNSTYTCDLKGIYAALVHEGYTIDFIDDRDIEGGFLTKRGYQILYVTAPNISLNSITVIDAWVKNGGNLVVTQGAGIYDEFNSPSLSLNNILGVKNRASDRIGAGLENFPIEITDNLISAGLPVLAPLWLNAVEKMSINGATALYTLPTGEPMITQNKYGNGYAFCFGFLPGLQYLNASYEIRDSNGRTPIIPLMRKWRDEYRLFTLLPVSRLALAGTIIQKQVTIDQKLVEAIVMESATTTAIILFNWNNSSVSDLSINLSGPNTYNRVSSAQGATISNLSTTGVSIQFTLSSLQYVDVIMMW
jgi:hypothetical protein